MKALLVSYWHELSDDDLARIDGKRDGLAHVIREWYGLNDTEAGRDLCLREGRPPPGGGQVSSNPWSRSDPAAVIAVRLFRTGEKPRMTAQVLRIWKRRPGAC